MLNHNAFWIASVFGPFLTILGIWMIFYHENLAKIYSSIKATPALIYTRATTNLLVGLFIISMYNYWYADVTLLVTLLGWVYFVRGIVLLYFPKFVIRMTKSDQTFFQTRGIIPFIWGLLLLWVAFWR